MANDWLALTRLTQGDEIEVERVRIIDQDIAVEGRFKLPALCRLTVEDQTFVTAFIRCHGSLKEMEALFGISYPTVKNRLNKIAQKLDYVEVNPPSGKGDVLDLLEKGEITIEEAEKRLKEIS